MELSTSLNVLFDPERITARQAVERLADAGFRALDFNFVDWLFDGSPFIGDDWRPWLMDVRRRADELGLRFSQAHGPIFNKFEKSERARWLTDMSHRSLEGAALLGSRWVVYEPEIQAGAFDRAHTERVRQLNLEWFRELLPTAGRTGAGIAIENIADIFSLERGIGRSYCSTPAELIDLVDSFDDPLIGICWDTGHAHIQRLDQGKALRAIGKRLKALHIQDNDGRSDQHLLPFYGGIDWAAIMAALRDIGYQGDFTYEIHNSVLPLPDALRDAVLRFTVDVGLYLLDKAR
jgi:sugar phosphate isomerase/epimerase